MTVGMGVWAWRAWCLLRVGHRNHRIEPDSSHLFTASAAQLAMLVLTRTSRLNVPPGMRPVRTRENGDTLWRRLGTRGHLRVTIHSAATATPATCATINVGQIVLTRVASNWHVPNGQSCCGHLAGPSTNHQRQGVRSRAASGCCQDWRPSEQPFDAIGCRSCEWNPTSTQRPCVTPVAVWA